jgi:hypothetical protein
MKKSVISKDLQGFLPQEILVREFISYLADFEYQASGLTPHPANRPAYEKQAAIHHQSLLPLPRDPVLGVFFQIIDSYRPG